MITTVIDALESAGHSDGAVASYVIFYVSKSRVASSRQLANSCRRHRLSVMSGVGEPGPAAATAGLTATAPAAGAAVAPAAPPATAATAAPAAPAAATPAGTPAVTPTATPANTPGLPAALVASMATDDGRTIISSGQNLGLTQEERRITHYLTPDIVPEPWRGEDFQLYEWQVGCVAVKGLESRSGCCCCYCCRCTACHSRGCRGEAT